MPEHDHRFMTLALRLARRGLGRTWPNPAVGAVIVRDDGDGPRIIGRGWTQPRGRPHAETMALAQAGEAARGATLYVTLEPCSHHGKTPPCADAIIAAGISRVVAAAGDPDPRVGGMGFDRLCAAGIAVETGLLSGEAGRDLIGHVNRIMSNRPYVQVKLAVSADERLAGADRAPVAVTGEAVRAKVHLMRARADAILVGIGTALADDPELTCRLPGMAARSPVRIVLDSRLRLPENSALAGSARDVPVWAVCGENAPLERTQALTECGVQVLRMPLSGGRPVLLDILQAFAVRGVTRLMVEGGGETAGAFMRAGLVDEAVIFKGKTRLGEGGVRPFGTEGLAMLEASALFKRVLEARLGEDRMTVYRRKENND